MNTFRASLFFIALLIGFAGPPPWAVVTLGAIIGGLMGWSYWHESRGVDRPPEP